MSKKSSVINPNEKSHGFAWAMAVLIIIIVGTIGYVVYANRSNSDSSTDLNYTPVSTSIDLELDNNTVVLSSSASSDDSAVIDLYEDYSCPHCADLAAATDSDMLSAIEDGSIIVYIHDLNFLDRGQDDGNSTRVGAATYAIAENESPELYWNFRAMALENQTTIYNDWDLDDLADAARELGASEETAQAIANFDYQDQFLEDTAANADTLEGLIGNVSSPHVFINGESVEAENLTSWVSIAEQADGPSTSESTTATTTSENATTSSSSESATSATTATTTTSSE